MKKTIITISNHIKSVVTKATEPTKSTKSITTSNRRIVNPDGTIAESIETYRQFKADLANRSYGC